MAILQIEQSVFIYMHRDIKQFIRLIKQIDYEGIIANHSASIFHYIIYDVFNVLTQNSDVPKLGDLILA
jgi:hypothetical protein